MKTIFIFFFTSVFLNLTIAQNTTEEEYNWMSKGYSVMLSSGLDMKKGYYFDDNHEKSESISNYLFTYKFLRREKDKSLAGIVIIAKSSSSGRTYFYGLPIGSWEAESNDSDGKNMYVIPAHYSQSDYIQNFLVSINELDCTMTRAFFATLWNVVSEISMRYVPNTNPTPTGK